MMQRLAAGARAEGPGSARDRMPGMHGRHDDARHAHAGGNGSSRGAKGAGFDRLFLEGMIKHHGGALTMVQELFATAGRRAGFGHFRLRVRRRCRSADGNRSHERRCSRSCRNEIVVARFVSVGALLCRWRSQRARSSRPATKDPRVGLKAGLHDAGEAARNMELVASMPQARGLLRSEAPAGSQRRRASAGVAAAKPRQRRRRSARQPRSDAPRAPGSRRAPAARLRQLRSRVQPQPPVHRQLQRLQHVRHRHAEASRGCWRRSSAPAARATCRSTATCCSCRSSRRAAASTAARRA